MLTMPVSLGDVQRENAMHCIETIQEEKPST